MYDCVGDETQWTAAQQILEPEGQFVTIVDCDPEMKVTSNYLATVGSRLLGNKIHSTLNSAKQSYTFHGIRENYQDLDSLRTRFLDTG